MLMEGIKKLNVFFYEEGVTSADKSINTDLYETSASSVRLLKNLK